MLKQTLLDFAEKPSLAGIAESGKVSVPSSGVAKPKSLSLDLELQQPGGRPRSRTESPMTPTGDGPKR